MDRDCLDIGHFGEEVRVGPWDVPGKTAGVARDQVERATKKKNCPEIPRLPDKPFRQVLEEQGDRRKFKEVIPEDFHNFINLCYDDKIILDRIVLPSKRIGTTEASRVYIQTESTPSTSGITTLAAA